MAESLHHAGEAPLAHRQQTEAPAHKVRVRRVGLRAWRALFTSATGFQWQAPSGTDQGHEDASPLLGHHAIDRSPSV
jgi:hypothetical protein